MSLEIYKQKQLQEFHYMYPDNNIGCIDVYDNSTGHGCYPLDTLKADRVLENPWNDMWIHHGS